MKESTSFEASQEAHTARKSACMTAAQESELERVRRLSVRDRMLEALAIGDRFASLKPEQRERNRV